MAIACAGCGKSKPKAEFKPELESNKGMAKVKPETAKLATSGGNTTVYNLNPRVPRYKINWKGAKLDIASGSDFAELLGVEGEAFQNGKEASKFRAEKAELKSSKPTPSSKNDILVLQGAVNIDSLVAKAKIKAQKVEWVSSREIYVATGAVTVESESGVLGPVPRLVVNAGCTKVATSEELLKP